MEPCSAHRSIDGRFLGILKITNLLQKLQISGRRALEKNLDARALWWAFVIFGSPLTTMLALGNPKNPANS